jgi:hypothetical protein
MPTKIGVLLTNANADDISKGPGNWLMAWSNTPIVSRNCVPKDTVSLEDSDQ